MDTTARKPIVHHREDGVEPLEQVDGHLRHRTRRRDTPHTAPAIDRCVTSTANPRRRERDAEDGRLVRLDLPRRSAIDAMQVAVDGGRQDVELLAAVGAVAVAQQAEFLEDVERPVDGRGDGARVDLAAAFDQLGAGHVAVGLRQDLDERPPLRCPAQAARTQTVADTGPREVGFRSDRSGCASSCESIDEVATTLKCNPLRYRAVSGYPFQPSPEDPPRVRHHRRHRRHRPDRSRLRRPAHRPACSGSATASTGTTSPPSPTSPARPRRPGWPTPRTPSSTVGSPATRHAHGGDVEMRAHDAGPGGATLAPALATRPILGRTRFLSGQGDAIRLGTLYALGHGAVVIALGLAAIAFGALLPDWLDPIMGRIVGLTLVALGVWVMYSVYRYARAGERFRLRSRWMLVFDGMRYGWRRLQARIHGHEHVEPLEMSSYGARTSFGVGMIHGVGAETGTQVLLIAAVGGASSAGLGVPMLFAFVARSADLELRDRDAQLGQLRLEPGARAALRRGRRRGRPVQPVRRDDLPVRPRRRRCRTSGAILPF